MKYAPHVNLSAVQQRGEFIFRKHSFDEQIWNNSSSVFTKNNNGLPI